MTRVVVDGMGGDLAPEAPVAGALAAARAGIEVSLVGDEARIASEVARLGGAPPGLTFVHAADAIQMGEHAAREALRRRDSSIYVGMRQIKAGEADAFVSAGNTGAVLAIAVVVLSRLTGVERPAIGVVIPIPAGQFLLLDAGANAESRASHLVQFAHLGASYMRVVGGVAEPRVGLLNIGEEGGKGSQLTIEAHERLEASGLRFVGNIEGRDLPAGRADVVVTDGFSGNVALKVAEGVIDMVLEELRQAAATSWRARLGGLLLRPAARGIRDKLDYRLHGAAPLLGVGGSVFIAHGASEAAAVEQAIRRAAEAADRGVVEALREAVANSIAGEPA